MDHIVIIAFLGMILVLNLVTTAWVATRTTSTKKQKAYLVLLIWLLPILGAFICFSEMAEAQEKRKKNRGSNSAYAGDSGGADMGGASFDGDGGGD